MAGVACDLRASLSRTQPSPLAATPHRFPSRLLRTRAGGVAPGLLPEAVDVDEPVTATRRAPPGGLTLAYVLEKLPADTLSEGQTEPSVWQTPGTLREAWRALYAAHDTAVAADPVRAAVIRAKDLPALARCTAFAETLHLLSLLPFELRAAITAHPSFLYDEVEELFLHLGQDIEVRGGSWLAQLPPPSPADLQLILRAVGRFGEDGRGCISGTAHRAAVWRGRHGEPLGVTVRVGRFVPSAANALLPLARLGSVLVLSRAGVGKTTLLRDLAAAIAHEPGKPRVTVVDTSNEIGGDGAVPMAFLGRCRRIQVPTRDQQGRVMTEVIQNHSPEFLVVDELATAEEAQAAWSIAQRGVRLIATCHGESLAGLLQNQSLNLLVGGAAQAFLSNEERRLRNKTKKTVLERPHPSPFRFVVELNARNSGYVYVDVDRAVDLILDDQNAKGDASVGGPITLDEPLPPRLDALVVSQGRRARQRESAASSGQSADGDCVSGDGYLLPYQTTYDEDGYVVKGGSAGRRPQKSERYDRGYDQNGGGSRSERDSSRAWRDRRGGKSNGELLQELDRFM